MDGPRFDTLLRAVAESRRSLLGMTLVAASSLVLPARGSEARKKKGKKKKKKGAGDGACLKGQTFDGKAAPICTPPERIFCDGRFEWEHCPGEANNVCCRFDTPVCGRLLIPGSIEHTCCAPNERWCEPANGYPTVGFCVVRAQKCCEILSVSGTTFGCDPTLRCCPGRDGTKPDGACCLHECCQRDSECPAERSTCNVDGCCVRTCVSNGEPCGGGITCCEDEDSCENGICRRHRGDVCDETIICSERYPHCIAFCQDCLGTCQRCPADQVSTGTDEICCPPNRRCNNARGGRGACCENDGCCLPDEDGDPCGLSEYVGEGQCG